LTVRVFRLFVLSFAAFGALAPACKTARTPTPISVVTIDTGEWKIPFKVELAVTDAEQQRGLMFREHLESDAGMLFVFDRDSVHTFWMRNTLIPLDMLFIGADKKVVGIVENAEPRTEIGRSVGIPSRYVLEIGGGLSKHYGFGAGQTVLMDMTGASK
jgi:uncharacterized membrane protein (UPF0127 family)